MLVSKNTLKRLPTITKKAHNVSKTMQVLAPFFGGMISFVKDNEGYIERGEMARINVNESKMAINKQFVYKCLS